MTLNNNDNNQLIKISTNENGDQSVSAKTLYSFLTDNDKKNYKRWVKRNILDNQFAIENEDYIEVVFQQKTTSKGGQCATDYALTIEFAKKLAMLMPTEKGNRARKYFINCEKKLKSLKQMTMSEIVAYSANNLVKLENEQKELKRKQKEIETAQLAQKQQINKIEAKVTDINTDYYTIAGYASLRGANIDASYANLLGRKAAKLSRQFSIDINKVHSTIFGTVNSYNVDILKQVFKNIK